LRTALVLTALVLATLAGVAAYLHAGLYPIGATEQHTRPVYWLLNAVMRRAVVQHAAGIGVPILDDRALIERGAGLYERHCTQCHGAPGVAPDPFALGMLPVPANLALTVREWRDPAELYWVVRHGIKMSGMPAWEFRLADAELWAVVAFLVELPLLGPPEYQALLRAASAAPTATPAATPAPAASPEAEGGDAARGRVALQQYACISCHVIPGVVGADFPVGPSLAGIGRRKYLAGVLANSPEHMVRWLRAPQDFAPGTAMPDLGVTERDARDIAAYLETLR
jgi:mono/diheme cytochrome c family protein